MPAISALDSGNPDSEDESKKADRLAARAARFNNKLAGNRYKELEEARTRERRAYENQGLITAGKTELEEAVDMRGTCESMCSDYEAEFREFTGEVHPLEARDSDRRRIDHPKAVAAYTRSDAGAGHGEAAKLPSDLRTPTTLVKTLDYLFSAILPSQPTMPAPPHPTPRTSLGYTAGFIRDRTRAIRKEFAMQSSWGHVEAIESFERIARWHILCLRELQEETGMNTDMHIDSAELGRCFTSLRQHYNDRREETGLDMPCPNEPEFRAYMLIFDLTQKAVAISTAEVPSVILDHPNVQLAWQIRRAAQRNFDSQKEGSKQNAELGANIITSYVKSLRQAKAPYLLSCLMEIRLREMRRSALRALQRTYPRLKTEAIRRNEEGQIVERRMILMKTFERMMGCEEQEKESSAWDDVDPVIATPEAEGVEIARRFGLEVFEDAGNPIGVLINLGSYFDDNKDAPYTRRWKIITDKRQNIPYTDIINAKAGVLVDGTVQSIIPTIEQRLGIAGPSRAPLAARMTTQPPPQPSIFSFSSARPTATSSSAAAPPAPPPIAPESGQNAGPSSTAFNFSFAPPTPAPTPPTLSTTPTAAAPPSQFQFSFGRATDPLPAATLPAPPPLPIPAHKEFSFSAPSSSTVPATSTLPATVAPGPATSSASKRPTFFSTSATASPSTLPNPAETIPAAKTASPAVPPSSTPLGVSTGTATPRKISLRSSLTRSVSRPIASPEAEKRRHRQRALVDPVASMLIDEILGKIVRRITPEVERTVNSQIAAMEYTTRKAQRKQLISHWSSSIFDTIFDHLIDNRAKQATVGEIAKRARMRQSVSHWRGWTKEREEQRESAVRDRADVWSRLKEMGLGGEERSIRDSMAPLGSERMEEMEVDMGLHEAERLKEHFYSPSSFLHTIARHVSPILTRPSSSRSAITPRFQVLLSTSNDSASPPPTAASKWLIDKITTKNAEGEWWACEGVEYACPVRSRYDELDEKDMGRLGLVLLEVPMTSALKAERDTNAADVQDRLSAISDVISGSGVAYAAPLIILSWHEETLDEITERLDLSDCLSQFGHIGLMCLSHVDDLDVRFGEAVRGALSSNIKREQLVLQMGDVVSMILQPWQKLLDSAELLLQLQPENVTLAVTVFQAGVASLNYTSELVKSWMDGVTSQNKRTPFNPLTLPNFDLPGDIHDISLAVLAIEEYLQADLFADLQDVQLIGSTLHPASMRHNNPLPISALLASIATFTLGELSSLSVRLEVYGTTEYITTQHADFLNTVSEGFTSRIEQNLGTLSSLLPSQATPGQDPETVGGEDAVPTSRSSRSLKRSASTQISPVLSKEGKSKKNARLLRAIREVERSLGELSAGTEGEDEDSVGFEVGSELRRTRTLGEVGMSF